MPGAPGSFGAFAARLIGLFGGLLLRGLLLCPLLTRRGRLLWLLSLLLGRGLLLLLLLSLLLGRRLLLLLLLRLLLARGLLLLSLLLRCGLLLLRFLLGRGFPLLLLLRFLLSGGLLLLRFLLGRTLLSLLLLRLLLSRHPLLLLLLRALLGRGLRRPGPGFLSRGRALCLLRLKVLLHDSLMRLITVVLILNHVLLLRARIFVPRILPLVDR